MTKFKVVPHNDPVLVEYYSDFIELFPDAVFVRDPNDVICFKANDLIRWLVDKVLACREVRWKTIREDCPADLNSMCIAHQEGAFSLKEYMQFYMDMGYSLCGFAEIFGAQMRKMLQAKKRKEKKPSHIAQAKEKDSED